MPCKAAGSGPTIIVAYVLALHGEALLTRSAFFPRRIYVAGCNCFGKPWMSRTPVMRTWSVAGRPVTRTGQETHQLSQECACCGLGGAIAVSSDGVFIGHVACSGSCSCMLYHVPSLIVQSCFRRLMLRNFSWCMCMRGLLVRRKLAFRSRMFCRGV